LTLHRKIKRTVSVGSPEDNVIGARGGIPQALGALHAYAVPCPEDIDWPAETDFV
jgi:hypothetical protein